MLLTPKGLDEMVKISRAAPTTEFTIERILRQMGAGQPAIMKAREEQFSYDAMERRGCTANVVLFVKNQLICANAGDSRCVVAEGGKAVPLSEDHKPTNEKELERIHAAGSTVNEEGRIDGNLNLSRAIGDI